MLTDMLESYILNNTPFLLYANCNVKYEGRASSFLTDGNYLVIYKQDGSLQIHGANKIQPRNYQGSNSKIEIINKTIRSINKRELIDIGINDVMCLQRLDDWSVKDITITKTEKDLVDKLERNWEQLINIKCNQLIREFTTEFGPVDIVGIDEKGIKHVIEVKRRKATVKDVMQLRKYLECINESIGYIASPQIGDKALVYLNNLGYQYLKISFDDQEI